MWLDAIGTDIISPLFFRMHNELAYSDESGFTPNLEIMR